MTKILRLDASARQGGSLTRALADRFVKVFSNEAGAPRVTVRDVGQVPPPAIDQRFIAAAFCPEAERTADQVQALALSDRLIQELAAADLLLVAAPMYNYGLPSSLKAWADHVIRVGKTFTFDLARGDFPLEPVLSGKTLILLTASGEFGFDPSGVRAGHDHLTPHMRSLAPLLGATAFHRVGIEYQEFGDARFERSKREAWQAVDDLTASLARNGRPRPSTPHIPPPAGAAPGAALPTTGV